MKKLKIGKSDIHGKGLFTGEPIKQGELIAKVHSGIQLDPETVKYMPTQYGRFYNHADKGFNTRNEIIGNHRYLRALKNIPANTELTANYREHSEMEQPEDFGSGKYASFDFDKTIATDEGLAKARQMLKDGYNLFIVSARDKVTPDMVARARKAGIPEENIIATGSDEAKVRKVKQLGVEKHFDDKPEVIAALGSVGEQFKKGGGVNSKRYTKSLTGTNKLFTKNNLFKKKSTKRIYDPNAKYFDNGGETTVEPEVECTDDGRCYETDQIQNYLDTGSQIPYNNLGVMWGVQEAVNPEGAPPGDANKEWIKRGAQSLSAYLGMKNPANCMWASGMGYQCLPETKGQIPKSAFKSNDSFISAVNKGTVPFKRVAKTNESDFDSKEKGLLRPGDIINFKGSNDTGDKNHPSTSHAMTFSHYREDGVPIYLDSNGEATDFNWNQGVWPGMKPNKKRTAYISRFDPEMFYKDEIQTLEEAARNNPTYYRSGGALLTKKVTCKKCGWTWDAADGGNDMTTCHKCGGKGLVHAKKGGAYYDDSRDAWVSADGKVGPNGPAYFEDGGDISIPTLNQFNNGGPNAPTGPEGGNATTCEEGYLWDAQKNECVPIVNMEDWFTNWYANRQLPFEEIPNKKYVNLMKERLPYYNPESTLLEHIQTAIPPVVYKPELADPMGQGAVVFNQRTGLPENIEIRESLKNTPTELNATLLHEGSTAIDTLNSDKIFPAQNMVIDPGLVMFDDRWGDLKGMDRENAELAYDYQTDPEQDNIHSLIFEERYKRDLKPNQTITEEDINKWKAEAEASGALDRSSPNFDHTLYTLFKLARTNKDLSNWFNQLASNDSPKNDNEPQYAKQGGSMGYQLGDEVDEATMRQLMNQGYVFAKIS
jgi:hypothetical protein